MNFVHPNLTRSPLRTRVRAGVVAGFLAILVNTAILIVADRLHIVTARGGLLTLLLRLAGPPVPRIAGTWSFKQLFHIVVGVGMAIGYAVLFGNAQIRTYVKGLLTAMIVWLANACVILPMIGQGFAGSHELTAAGMITFAIAHTIFFVMTALLYERFRGLH